MTDTIVEVPTNIIVIETQGSGVQVLEKAPEQVHEAGEPQVLVKTGTVDLVVVYHGAKGDKGEPGIPEEEMAYAKRVDWVTEYVFYRGEAAAGSLTASPVWRIRKVTLGVDDDVTEEWAGGTAGFDKVWDSRTLYSYV